MMKLVRNLAVTLSLPLLFVVSFLAAGCGAGSQVNNVASLRIVHASANAPNVDVLLDKQGLTANLPFSYATPYAGVSGNTHQIGVYATATEFANPVFPIASVSTPAGTFTSVYAINDLATIAPLVTVDNNTEPATGTANIRVIHLAPDVPGGANPPNVDVYVLLPGTNITTLAQPITPDGVTVFGVLTDFPYAGNDATDGVSSYLNLNAATAGTKYEIQVFPTGVTGPPTAAAIDSVITLKSQQVRTILALDQAFSSTGSPNGKFQASVLADLN